MAKLNPEELKQIQVRVAENKASKDNIHLLICGGTGCHATGSIAVKDALKAEIAEKKLEEKVRVIETGWRAGTMRMAFTLREGNEPSKYKIPGRMIGKPPLEAGPLKGVMVDNLTQSREYLDLMGWDPQTAKPTSETLEKLGLGSVVK